MRSLLAAAAEAAAAAAAPGAVSITQSTAAGERWADKGTVAWGPDFASTTYVTVDRARAYQTVLGWGGALTDTSAINWLMMNSTSQARFMAAYWGDVSKGALGYNVHSVAINSPDYAAITFNYDDFADDFALAHFDANLTYDREHVVPFIHAVKVRRAALRASGRSAGRWHARPCRTVARPPRTTHVRPWTAPTPSLTLGLCCTPAGRLLACRRTPRSRSSCSRRRGARLDG
jgi:O-glycosyl hydrolase